MLEHYEIVELEKKWEEYTKKKNKNKFINRCIEYIKIKPDRTIYLLTFLIAACIGAIAWILFSENFKDNPNIHIVKDESNTTKIISNDENITVADVRLEEKNSSKDRQEYRRDFLSINDIGIKSSEDGGGFVFNNQYDEEKKVYSNDFKEASQKMSDELIDFGNAPNPPRNLNRNSGMQKVQRPNSKPKITIQTSALKTDSKNLEDKFNQTKDITYSLEISQEAYRQGRYEKAIKWALISNELDKNNIESWVLFAKANYKLGKKNDAIISLEALNKRVQSSEISNLIDDIKNGVLK